MRLSLRFAPGGPEKAVAPEQGQRLSLLVQALQPKRCLKPE
jgi:hypothetical protein